MKKALLLLFLLAAFYKLNSQVVATWSEQTSGVTTQLTSVSAADNNNVWICGYAGVVLRTTNGGTSWQSVASSPIPPTLDLHNIYAIDANTALVCGSGTSAFVFKTINGGANWTQVFTQTGGFMNALIMVNPVTGFMYGDPVGGRWSLWGTLNGGTSWDSTSLNLPQVGSEAGWNNAMFYDGTSIWFGTNNTRIYRTVNLLQWTAQATTGQLNSYAVWFNGSVNGLTGGTALLMTSNSGTNWGAVPTALPGTANISGITGITPNIYWVIRQGTAIYFTSNSGTTWATQYTAPVGSYRHITKSRINNYIFAVRSNGGISKALVLLTNVQNISSEIPANYELAQNYPNPFNPSTTINFNVPRSSDVSIKVFDILGKEIALLVNGRLNPGKYSVIWNAENAPSGTYFYVINADGFRDVKKMILIK